jgi:hypothetical protein
MAYGELLGAVAEHTAPSVFFGPLRKGPTDFRRSPWLRQNRGNGPDGASQDLRGVSAEGNNVRSITWRVLLVLAVTAVPAAIDRALTPLAF